MLLGENEELTSQLPEGTPLKTIQEQSEGPESSQNDEAPDEPVATAGQILVQLSTGNSPEDNTGKTSEDNSGKTPEDNILTLELKRAEDLPSVTRGGTEYAEVHITIALPQHKLKFKTKRFLSESGRIDESFSFSTPSSTKKSSTKQSSTKSSSSTTIEASCQLRFKVYGCGGLNKMLLGEVDVGLNKLFSKLSSSETWLSLRPKGVRGDEEDEDAGNFNVCEISSLASFGESLTVPELLVNLHYKDLTGRLTVEVIRGANLKREYMLLNPDTYVKIKVISSKGKRIGRSKTTTRRNNSDPEYNETFVYTMSVADLKDATMMFTLYGITKKRASKKKIIIGWFAFGKNTSGSGETNHWKEMTQNPDMDICHWRQLLPG